MRICAPLWHALWRRALTLPQCTMWHEKFLLAKPQRQFRTVLVCILEFYCGVVGLIAAASVRARVCGNKASANTQVKLYCYCAAS